jgi:hypothetical protein
MQHHTTKAKRQETMLVEMDTANLLLCLRVNYQGPSLPASTGVLGTADNEIEEDIIESITTKVYAEAPIIFEKYLEQTSGGYQTSSTLSSSSSGNSGSSSSEMDIPDGDSDGSDPKHAHAHAIQTESLDSAKK